MKDVTVSLTLLTKRQESVRIVWKWKRKLLLTQV